MSNGLLMVLKGPKSPHRACNCGQGDNWASCRACRWCGRDAPWRVLHAAKKAYGVAGAGGGPGNGSNGGQHARGLAVAPKPPPPPLRPTHPHKPWAKCNGSGQATGGGQPAALPTGLLPGFSEDGWKVDVAKHEAGLRAMAEETEANTTPQQLGQRLQNAQRNATRLERPREAITNHQADAGTAGAAGQGAGRPCCSQG